MNLNVGLPEADWNKTVGESGHFLQSREWALFQLAMGRTVLSCSSKNWSWLATIRTVSGFRYLYVAYGPTSDSNGLKESLASLAKVAKDQNADFVRVEPIGVSQEDVLATGLKLIPIEEIEPAMTSIIDLTQTEEQLRQNLASGHRNAINGAKRRGITIRRNNKRQDVSDFVRLINQTAAKAGIRVHEPDYFRTMMEVLEPLGAARLYLAEVEGKTIAATIIFTSSKTWYYAHAASDPAYLKLQAGVPLLWQAILDAKVAGASTFDLWGVVPPGDTGAKAGYSRFKRAFGGTDKLYAGTWDLVDKPLKYGIFKLARNTSRLLRAVKR